MFFPRILVSLPRPGTVYDHILEKNFKKRFLTKISNPYGNFKRYYPDFFQIQFGLTQPGTVEISGKNHSIILSLNKLRFPNTLFTSSWLFKFQTTRPPQVGRSIWSLQVMFFIQYVLNFQTTRPPRVGRSIWSLQIIHE